MKVYIVAYYFRPYKGVGSFRVSYWYDCFLKDHYNIEVITATPGNNDPSVTLIPVESTKFFSIDDSMSWGLNCASYLKKQGLTPEDIVIVTGGPFLHFLPLARLKKNMKFKLILDYRDPLALNPINQRTNRFINLIVKSIKKFYERYVNNAADKIIAVNNVCKNLVIGSKGKVEIIENGYDERFFNLYSNTNKVEKNIRLVYSGKIYGKRDISPFVDALKELGDEYEFAYIGNSNIECNSCKFKNYGFLDYKDNANILCRSSIGIVLCSGESFESTTKIFDYFAAKLKILIITSGELHSGNINNIVKENPNVEWAYNDKKDIISAIEKLKRPYKDWDFSLFSRNHGYNKLITIICNNKESN